MTKSQPARKIVPPSIRRRRSRITSTILRWYRTRGRELPWRHEKDPYRVIVSEVMLQQTQVSRVLEKYPEFLRRYPTMKSLARATSGSVIKSWSGMGYNNRALRLRELARIVVGELDGVIPQDVGTLQKLPGIGRYTANAVACFAFGSQVPVVDTNVMRVFGRLCPSRKRSPRVDLEYFWELAAEHLPRRSAHDWNQALMDLGATTCTAARPRCDRCPVRGVCPSAHAVEHNVRPRKPEKARDGVPNRIVRGKVIETLRALEDNHTMSITTLGRRAIGNLTPADRPWFRSLLENLERDGLVRFRGRTRISLPD